jgi:hypothetical protein
MAQQVETEKETAIFTAGRLWALQTLFFNNDPMCILK